MLYPQYKAVNEAVAYPTGIYCFHVLNGLSELGNTVENILINLKANPEQMHKISKGPSPARWSALAHPKTHCNGCTLKNCSIPREDLC